jgi:hypothetical protein
LDRNQTANPARNVSQKGMFNTRGKIGWFFKAEIDLDSLNPIKIKRHGKKPRVCLNTV